MANYLGVGIHENVVLSQLTGINDKGSLVLELTTKVDNSNMLAAFDEGSDVEQSSASLIMWPVNMTTWDGKKKTATQIGQDLNNFKNTLVDILEVFMTSDKAKASLNAEVMFAGLGITPETQQTLPTRLLDEGFVKSVYTNISKAFITAASPFMDNTTFRVKLRRTSKAKHFAMIPPKGKFKEIWIEPMTVPAASTQIKWSKYELDNGFDSGAKVETDTVSEEAQSNVESMFSAPPVPATDDVPQTPPANPFNQ